MTILIRDRAQEDKVVKVIEPLDTVNLTFDWENNEGRLAFVKTHWPNYNGVEISSKHAGFIVNSGKSKAEDMLYVIDVAKKAVKEKFRIQLEEEVKILG